VPTLPTPATTTWVPSRELVPEDMNMTAFMAQNTPKAVAADGSPDPPRARLTPVT